MQEDVSQETDSPSASSSNGKVEIVNDPSAAAMTGSIAGKGLLKGADSHHSQQASPCLDRFNPFMSLSRSHALEGLGY